MDEEIETQNDFMLSVTMTPEPNLRFLFPPTGDIDKETALRTAAWLVSLADPLQERFPAVLKAVQNT